jgi:hypothetical protein
MTAPPTVADPLSPNLYPGLNPAELRYELGLVVSRLAGSYTELSAVKVQYLWLYHQGYKASIETSVSGREHDAEMAAVAVKEDELTLEGNIASLSVLRDLLVTLVERNG